MDGGHAETWAAPGLISIRKSPQAMPLARGALSVRSFASKRAGGMKKAGTGDASTAPGSVEWFALRYSVSSHGPSGRPSTASVHLAFSRRYDENPDQDD
jgi:hypothetical protein